MGDFAPVPHGKEFKLLALVKKTCVEPGRFGGLCDRYELDYTNVVFAAVVILALAAVAVALIRNPDIIQKLKGNRSK